MMKEISTEDARSTASIKSSYVVKFIFVTYVVTQVINEIILFVFVETDLRLIGYVLFFMQLWLGISAGLIKHQPSRSVFHFLAGPILLFLSIHTTLKLLIICTFLSSLFLGLTFLGHEYNSVWAVLMLLAQYFGFCSIYCCLCLFRFSEIKITTKIDTAPGVILFSPFLGFFMFLNSIKVRLRECANPSSGKFPENNV